VNYVVFLWSGNKPDMNPTLNLLSVAKKETKKNNNNQSCTDRETDTNMAL
jgi:hypothetical protein